MSRTERRTIVGRAEDGLSRSSLYYQPKETSAEDLALMTAIDRLYLRRLFYGARRMAAQLRADGHQVGRKRLGHLMCLMGLEAIYQKPKTSRSGGHVAQLRLQASAVIDVPYQFFPMMPFVLTIVAMALLSRNARVPAALLVPFRKEER